MILAKRLDKFYTENGIPDNGGVDNDTFQLKFSFINLTLPNPKFRKDVIHIHDIQHILNDCDTSWKGEGYIAGWEIATKFWKYFPVCIFSFWAMGYSLWMHPVSVYKGFKKGLNNIGIIDLGIEKSEFMEMEFDELVRITKKEKFTKMGVFQWIQFLFWSFISQVIFLFPFLLIIFGILYMIK